MSGDPRPASKILDARLREVAIHHLDLDAGYSASDWPVDFALRILLSVLPAFESRGIEAVTLLPTDIDSRISVNGGSAIKVTRAGRRVGDLAARARRRLGPVGHRRRVAEAAGVGLIASRTSRLRSE